MPSRSGSKRHALMNNCVINVVVTAEVLQLSALSSQGCVVDVGNCDLARCRVLTPSKPLQMTEFANIVLISKFKVFVDGQHVADVPTPGLVPSEQRFKDDGLKALAQCKAAFKDGLRKSRKRMFVVDGQQDSGADDADNVFDSVYGIPWVHDTPAPAFTKDGSGPGIGVLRLVSVAEDVPGPVRSGNRRKTKDKLQVWQLTTTARAKSPLSKALSAQNGGL